MLCNQAQRTWFAKLDLGRIVVWSVVNVLSRVNRYLFRSAQEKLMQQGTIHLRKPKIKTNGKGAGKSDQTDHIRYSGSPKGAKPDSPPKA